MKICFVNAANPDFLGGITLYQKNLINSLDKKNFEITWIYKGTQDRKYSLEGVNYIEVKVPKVNFWNDIVFNKKILKIFKKNYFDIINSHAIWGSWIRNYVKRKNQRIIHTYHGVTLPYYKIQLQKYNFLIRSILYLPLITFAYFIEKPPMKKADRIICVSNKVKRDVMRIYGERKNISIIRTGVDTQEFKKANKFKCRDKLKLKRYFNYGLYVGRGGYWIKGLDRVVRLGEEIYKLDKDYRLILLGPDKHKVKDLIKRDFIICPNQVPRSDMKLFYSATDLFFCASRYEGGAPILALSESMSSGNLVICSRSSEQEIIIDDENGIIIDNFDVVDAKRILRIENNKVQKNKITESSLKTIMEFSIDKWSKEYMKVILDKK